MAQQLAERVEEVLDRTVRPWLAHHGGGIEVISLEMNGLDATDAVGGEGATVRVRMTGGCTGCPAASAELSEFVAAEIQNRLPEIRAVVPVQGVSDALLAQARALLTRSAARRAARRPAAQ